MNEAVRSNSTAARRAAALSKARISDGFPNIIDGARVESAVPFGGHKDSGVGVQFGSEGLKQFCHLRILSIKKQ
ncbi:hypothetical protein IVB18_13930 [Bradyrhizobium sp. 186]|uniref:hypothetical protein n=1 Tax=Bradyrhizobium sp. 186 TaxID=2782654 RepID=UPI00200178F2|nr:hypothetical protein [Bradyrhizobium sp. 186]UPK38245.1 hypothetical protein IVB18_13930 [Bradyrhizobium sp. 186]